MTRQSFQNEILLEKTSCIVCGSNHSEIIAQSFDFEYETSKIKFTFVTCQNCHHVYLNPRPKLESASIIYPNTYYTFSGEKNSAILRRIKDWVVTRRIRKFINKLQQHASILEVGCGDGSTLLAIRNSRPDLKIVGLDFQFSAYHRKLLQNNRIEIIESMLEEAMFEQSFDLVIMNQLIEHLWDCRASMNKINIALKPGGLLSISTPNLDGYDRKLFPNGLWGGYHTPRHLNLFTEISLEQFLEQFGFEKVASFQLVAPLIWVTNIHNYLKIKGYSIYKYFNYYNLPVLSFFTILDIAIKTLGISTSNQQIICRKISTPTL
jgi:2-polyprenyl-3-methyl-5-hydroxy-6-metoxy-1,4-benzoquinol methylase